MAWTPGGWKAVQVSWIRGAKYNTGTVQDVYDFLADVLTAITSTGLWEIDPDIHPTAEPFLIDSTNLKWTHGLFLRRAGIVGGAKACITYTYRGSSFHGAYRALAGFWSTNNFFGGLCLSVIPPGGGSFDPTQYSGRGFIPDKGVPIQSAFMVDSGNGTGALYSALALCNGRTDAGWVTFTFLCKDDVIGVFLRSSFIASGATARGAFYGHIFDDDRVPAPDLETDLPASNYGMVHLSPCVRGDEFQNGNIAQGFNISFDSAAHPPMKDATSSGAGGGVLKRTATLSEMTDAQYYSVLDGCWISQMPTGIGILWQYSKLPQLPVGTSTRCAFSEIGITAAVADNTASSSRYSRGSATDSSFAWGTLRGDMILATRPAVWTRGQTFDGKNYIYVGGGCAVGWDASNTVQLFGT